jgi:AcrR family transcriptional regulator
MTGLRERQKAGRRRDILAAASQLFRKDGFADTSVEAIAALAEVGTGTVYNYFSSKGDLLMALVALDGEQVRAKGKRYIASVSGDAAAALYGLLAIYVDHSLVHLTKELWRNAMATAVTQADSPFGTGYFENDRLLAEQVSELVTALQAKGKMRADIDPAVTGSALFTVVNGLFMQFVARDAMPKAALHAKLRDQVTLLCSGLAADISSQRRRA